MASLSRLLVVPVLLIGACSAPLEPGALSPNPTAVSATTSCRALPAGDNTPNAVVVALADRGSDPDVLFVLDAMTGVSRGRIESPAIPEVALDVVGKQVILICGATSNYLMAFDLMTLRERWRVSITDPLSVKAVGGMPALAASPDGQLVFVMHAQALRADAAAPGGSRYYVSIHNARTGAQTAELDLPECGAGRLFAAGDNVLHVVCQDAIRVVDTKLTRVTRTIPGVASLRPVMLTSDAGLIGVSASLDVLRFHLQDGSSQTDSTWHTAAPIVGHFGRLVVDAAGQRLWTLTKLSGNPNEWGPDTLTEINLGVQRRSDTPIPDVRGVGLIGGRLVYFTQGRLRSADGALDVQLTNGPVRFWTVLDAL